MPAPALTYFHRDPAVKTCLVDDAGANLFHADTNATKSINETGLFIWQRLDGTHTAEDIAAALTHEYASVSAVEAAADVTAFIQAIARQGYAAPGAHDLTELSVQEVFPDEADGPHTLDVSLTGRCNLHCAYCFYADEMQARADLSTGAWRTFFAELGALPVRRLALSGGEALTRRDFWELVDAAIAHRMRYSLLTNGTLVTEKTLAALHEGKRRLRLDSVQVSIDGSCAEIHDLSRGQGAFVRAVRGLRLLHEAGLPVTARVTINRHNVDDLEAVARLLLDDIGLSHFGTNDAMPMGAGCFNQESICLTPAQKRQAMHTLVRLSDRYAGRITAQAGPLANWRMYHDMERARATGEMAAGGQMGYLTACGCVFGKLSVHHDGTLTPCNMLADLSLGRINETPLTQVWKTHPMLAALKARRTIPMSQVPGCEDCEWAPYCNGSCPGLAYELTGDFNRANPHDCYRRFVQEVGRVNAT